MENEDWQVGTIPLPKGVSIAPETLHEKIDKANKTLQPTAKHRG
jgi:hypothetical protein